MKKFLALLAIIAVLFLGVVGALAVIPHVHGNDFNHSKHETCPVYQLSLHHNFNAVFTAFNAAAVLFLFFYFVLHKENNFFSHCFSFALLRAPPVLA